MIHYDASDGACVLRLDSPPLNMITFPLLEELRAGVRRANADESVRGIVIAGDSHHLSAGADVNLFGEMASPEDAARLSRVFQDALQAVEDSPKPVVAAAAGKVMGSALELAAACHFRVSAEGTVFSMPEVKLGINPGAGGTGRLPRLIGAGAALRMLLTAEPVDARRALELGLVDKVCGEDELLARARGLALAGRTPLRTSERAEKVRDAAANEAAFLEAARLLEGVRPELIAPAGIVRAVRAGIEESFPAGLLEEQRVVAECMATPATRNRIYLFFAVRGMGKADLGKWGHDGIPLQESGDVSRGGRWRGAPASCPHADVEPAKVSRAAVVGMGSMGTGIAQALVMAGVPVAVMDADASAVRKGIERIARSLGRRVEEGRLSPARRDAMMRLVTPAARPDEIADADFVIEAVFEDAAVKRAVIGELEAVLAPDAVIASNTSTISLDVLAGGMRAPGRLVGMHFFNPAHRMPLVEVVRREGASDRAVATALAFARAIRKTPVLVRNREGFLVNRIFIPYLKEAFLLLEDGADPPAVDAAAVEFGFPMGPLALADMAGLDVLAAADDVMSRAFPAHGRLSGIARRLVELGALGQKTGGGVYRYEKGDYTPRPSGVAAGVTADVRRESGLAPRDVGQGEIAGRLVLRMVAEAFAVMEEGIVRREEDVDAATVLGTGFPDFRGGVIRHARDLGLGAVVARLSELAERFGGRFSPPRLLRDMGGEG